MSYSLATIYTLRALCITALIVAPKTNLTIYVFAATMGLLWLSTVPLTTGIVAQIFGVRYLATLFGIIFLSHQLGSFIGVWLGGYLYDAYGSYDPVWWAGVVLGLLAALIHLPIKNDLANTTSQAPSAPRHCHDQGESNGSRRLDLTTLSSRFYRGDRFSGGTLHAELGLGAHVGSARRHRGSDRAGRSRATHAQDRLR